MFPTTDRRSLLLTATMGVGAFAVPGFARAFAAANAQGFTHSVASGEPAATSVLLWTRYVPRGGGEARLKVELSPTEDFARIAGGGEVVTGPWRDHTAKITVDGLRSGTRYCYRFIGPDGSRSPVGRTRTLPDDGVEDFRIAIFSCANIGFGFFNAYAHAAERGDIDLAVHLGDYFYEHAPNAYPVKAEVVAGRLPQPDHEAVSLADYRLRYAGYRADPALAALHAALPMIAEWDDHDFANDPWEGGAQNHQKDEGSWSVRKAAAMQAWREWMPVSDEPWKAYDIGGLATLFRTETRVLARSRQPQVGALYRADDPVRALKRFRDGDWHDPAMTMMGSTQEAWLAGAMRRSVNSGRRWQIVGSGTVMGSLATPLAAERWLSPDAPGWQRSGLQHRLTTARAGLPMTLDSWGGYPAARERFLHSALDADANLAVISGDSHNGWAFDLASEGDAAAGVEFAGTSVTSHGLESATQADPRTVARDLVTANRELKWCDTSRRGYTLLTVGRDRIDSDWVFVDTITRPSTRAATGHRATVRHGRRRLEA